MELKLIYLINRFKRRYKELDDNDSIKASKTFKNNNYINLLDLNSEQNEPNSNLSLNDYLSYHEDENKRKDVNNNINNNLVNSFSFKNSKMINGKKNSNSSISANKIYKQTLFKKNSQNSHINGISNYQNDKKKNESSKIINNNINYKYDEINDELYPGEDFIIKPYENKKIKNIKEAMSTKANSNSNIVKRIQSTKIYSDKVYINNFNIYKTPNIQTCYNNNNNFKVKNEYKESKPRVFEKLEIAYSISKIDIKSSYENINKITNNRYISNEELKSKTKKFLMEECLILDNQLNFIKNI